MQQHAGVIDNNGKGSKKTPGKYGKVLPHATYTAVLLLTLTLILCAGNHDRPFQAVNNNGGSQDSKKEPPGVCT